MTANPGEIQPTLWPWQTDDFETKSLFPLLKRELPAWFIQPCLCNQWSRELLQLAAAAPASEMIETESHHRLTMPEEKFLQLDESKAAARESHIARWWYRCERDDLTPLR
jgi:hypothetical protein